MANYFNLQYESTAASSPGIVELNYGTPTSNGLTVHVSLYAGSGFTPTDYKMWGVELVEGEGPVTISGAEWITYTDTRTARLTRHNDPQYAYVKFRDTSTSGTPETDNFESNAVTFSFVEPIIHGTTAWKTDFEELGFDSAPANILKNDTYVTEVEFNKSKLDQLAFSGRNFAGLKLDPDTVYINPSSEIGQLIGLDVASYVTITKVFDVAETPMVMVDNGNGYETLTAYDNTVKTTISGENDGRVSNINWTSGTRTLTFDAYKFSTYGFCTVQKVEFTNDSQTAGYVGDTSVIRVYVQDTNGEPVENAPVTISGTGDSIGSFQESMPVDTGADGFAEFNFDVSDIGQALFEGNVDDVYFTDPDILFTGYATISGTQRSLLTQYEQIYKSYIYLDTISGVNDSTVAEPTTPTVSGSSDSVLEHDLNVLRTLMKQLKGTDDWFSSPPEVFDPENTDGSDTKNNEATLSSIAGYTLDAQTIITAVNDSNSGNGFSITPGDEGFLFTSTFDYAIPADRRGLPIYQSTTNSGMYYDEGGLDRVVGIDLINMETGAEFRDTSGDIIFAKFHDGADYSGTGDGTDVYVKFYTEAGPYTTVSGSDPDSIMIVFPNRKVMSEVEEYEWIRTDFVSSWEGDEIIVGQVADLWGYTGASDNERDPAWSSVAGLPIVDNQSSLKEALDALNDDFGDTTYSGTYISSGQSITDSLDALDSSLLTLSQTVTDGISDKHVAVVASGIAAGTAYQLPVTVSYTPSSMGLNMDVFLDGIMLAASSGEGGVNQDKDYAEISPTHVAFHFDVYQYSNITFQVRQ